MDQSTKRGLIVTGLLLTAAAGVYFFVKYKGKIHDLLTGGKTTNPASVNNSTTASQVQVINPGSSQQQPPNQSKAAPLPVLAKADDVLATSVTAANAKAVYATNDGVGVYNMNNQKSFETKKGQYLGVISYASPSSTGGFIIYFLGQGNVKYWIPSAFAQIKTG